MRPHGFERARGLSGLLCLILVMVLSRPASAQTSVPSVVDRLYDALSLHPDDPDLLWALARKLASSGRASEALQKTRGYLARWPERRPDARIEIAASLLDAGAYPEALVLLDEELRSNPTSAMAHFYRGIAFRTERLVIESNREFQAAGRLEPTLRAETLLARALGLFDLGKEDEAVALLKQVLEIDPGSESAIRARLLLRQREILDLQRAWRLDAYAGYEWDSNVTLENAENEVPATGRSDGLGVWGLGATWRALTREKGSLTVGYRYDQTLHDDLSEFDLLTNTGLLSGSLRLSDRFVLRLDALAWNTLEDYDDELTGGSIRPNLLISLGPRWGALRTFGQFEVLEYADHSDFSFLEQDGLSFGGGLEYFLPLPPTDTWLSTAVSFQRSVTQSDTGGGDDGFDGDYDYDSARIRSQATLPLLAEIHARVEAAYSYDHYHNDNLLDAIATIPNPDVHKREDHIVSARVELEREVFQHVAFEVYWRGTWRMSNVSLFDYDKQVVGAVFRVSTD